MLPIRSLLDSSLKKKPCTRHQTSQVVVDKDVTNRKNRTAPSWAKGMNLKALTP